MSFERRQARREKRAEKKEIKAEKKELKKQRKIETKDRKKEAKEKGKAIAETQNEITTFRDEVGRTTETQYALESVRKNKTDEILNNLLDFSTYGEYLHKLSQCETLLIELKKTKRHGLQKSGKEGVDQVTHKAKAWLDKVKSRRKRVEKDKVSPSEEISENEIAVDKSNIEEIQGQLKALYSDKAAAFANRLQTTALYPTNSKEGIKKGTKELHKVDKYRRQKNELLRDRLVAEAFDNKLEFADNFLEHAIQGRLTPEDIAFYNTHGLQIKRNLKGTDFPELIDLAYRNGGVSVSRYRTCTDGIGNLSNTSLVDAYNRHGIFGGIKCLLDSYTNMTGKQTTNWAKGLSLLGIGGLIFEGYKVASEGSEHRRETGLKMGCGFLGLQFLSQATTGKGAVDSVKGIFFGGDNPISRLINRIGGDSEPSGGNGNGGIDSNLQNDPNHQLLQNLYNDFDHNNQILAIPLIFPQMTFSQMDQKVKTFTTDPQAWTTFRNSIYQHYRNTNVWNAISPYFPEQFDQSKFTAWLNSLIPQRPENQDTLVEEKILTDFLEDALKEKGYLLEDGKTLKDLVDYVKQNKMTQLDDDTLGKLVTAKILKKDSNSGGSTPQDPDALQDQITDAIENGETADQIIARLEPTWTTHLNRCNGLSEANKKEILEAMKNLVRNDLLAQRYDINIEDGWFNILGNINPVTGYNYEKFTSLGEETHTHLEKKSIDDYEDVNGNEIQANSYEELIGAAHFINKIRSLYKNKDPKVFTLSADATNTLKINGTNTEFQLPNNPFIINHKNDFIRSLNDPSGLLSTRVG